VSDLLLDDKVIKSLANKANSNLHSRVPIVSEVVNRGLSLITLKTVHTLGYAFHADVALVD
jgi:hypothetical protein